MKSEFSLNPGLIYLNHAAVAPWPKRTGEAAKAFAEECVSLGAKNYPTWLKTEDKLREQLRELINAPSANDISLLKNTSEGLSVVASGIHWNEGENIVGTDQEFPSNVLPWAALESEGVEYRQADISEEEPEEAIFDLTDDDTRLIAVSSVQYGTGLRLDIEKIGNFCRENGILFCVDAIQSIGAVEFDAQKYHVDFAVADGHKWMLGPEGLALFYCREELRDSLELRQVGWRMMEDPLDFDKTEWTPTNSGRRFECGSPNMLGIHTLSASLSLLLEIGMDKVEETVLKNSEALFEIIENEDRLELRTDTAPGRYAGIVGFRPKKGNAKSVCGRLMKSGVVCAARSENIRFSPHFYTERGQLEKAVASAARFSE